MQGWIEDIITSLGSFGVGVLMLLENVFPPIPSEVVMPWAGYAASQDKVSLFGVIVVGSIGSFLGALGWYLAAKWIGHARLTRWVEKHGWWLTLSKKDVDRVDAWFEKWGSLAVLICRLIPGLRTLISIPAGFAEMPTMKFVLFTAVGTVAWTAILGGLGYWLGSNYESLSRPLGWVSTGVIVGLFAWWFYRLTTHAYHRRREQATS